MLAEAVAEGATAEAAAEAARAGVEAARPIGRPWQLALVRRPGSAFAGPALVGDTRGGAGARGVGSVLLVPNRNSFSRDTGKKEKRRGLENERPLKKERAAVFDRARQKGG